MESGSREASGSVRLLVVVIGFVPLEVLKKAPGSHKGCNYIYLLPLLRTVINVSSTIKEPIVKRMKA